MTNKWLKTWRTSYYPKTSIVSTTNVYGLWQYYIGKCPPPPPRVFPFPLEKEVFFGRLSRKIFPNWKVTFEPTKCGMYKEATRVFPFPLEKEVFFGRLSRKIFPKNKLKGGIVKPISQDVEEFSEASREIKNKTCFLSLRWPPEKLG